MPTDRRSQRVSDHPIDGTRADRARYLTMLGQWARGEVTLDDPDTKDDGTIDGGRK